jgi:hypothetical protein
MSAKEIVEQRLKESSQEVPATVFDSGFNSVIDAASKNFLKEGWDATVQKVALMEKVAALQDEDFVAGQQAAIDLLTQLSEDEYLSLIQGETQMSFEFGKEAAYADFVEMALDGAGFSDVIGAVNNTLNDDLEKIASEEEFDYKLGVDAACYEFLKVANEIYGEYDTEGVSDEEILDAILMKIAKDERSKEEVAAKLKERYGYHGSMGGVGKREGAKKKMVAQASEKNIGPRSAKESLLPAAKSADPAHKGSLADSLRYRAKNMSRNEKIGVGAGAAALGAGALGAGYLLNKRRKAKQEQEKSASDYRVQEALEILAEAGLLDD